MCSCLFFTVQAYGYHSQTHFIDIFQMEQFSAVKFAMGYEKNMSLLVIAKSPKVVKIGLGSFNAYACP